MIQGTVVDHGKVAYDELLDIAFSAPDYANGEMLYQIVEGRLDSIIDEIESEELVVNPGTGEVIDVYSLNNAEVRELAEDILSYLVEQNRPETITNAYGVAYESQEGTRAAAAKALIQLLYGRPATYKELLRIEGDEPWPY